MHTNEQLRGGARDFCTVLDQSSAFFVWQYHVSEKGVDLHLPSEEVLKLLHNAILESSLLSLRILNDFFTPGGFPSDIRAEDYAGYTSPGLFLLEQESRNLNKYLAHLTTERAERTTPQSWEIYDFIRRGHDAGLTFLRFINSPDGDQYHPDDLDTQSRIQICQRIEGDLRIYLKQPKS